MPEATLIISSKNYSSWSLRGWLLTRMSGLTSTEQTIALDDPGAREELLHPEPPGEGAPSVEQPQRRLAIVHLDGRLEPRA